MNLEVGKYYRTRYGRKVGPMVKHINGFTWNGGLWNRDGTPYYPDMEAKDSPTIIAEWIDAPSDQEPASPVRTVTRKEIVPGTYGKVRVTGGMYIHVNSMSTATELRAAITTLTQIAEALEESEQ